MEVYVTEEQQVEAIKKWFKKYGNMISWLIVGVLGIVSAITYWQHHQEVLRLRASERYMTLLEAFDQEDETTIKNEAQQLVDQYPHSPYATLASFARATDLINKKEYAQAEQQLLWALEHGQQKDLQAIARVRLMRLYESQNKLDEAMDLFDEKKAHGFLTLMAEIKGDILMKKKEIAAAREAYLQAYKAAPEAGLHGPLLKMKMQELGVEIPESEEAPTEDTSANEALKS